MFKSSRLNKLNHQGFSTPVLKKQSSFEHQRSPPFCPLKKRLHPVVGDNYSKKRKYDALEKLSPTHSSVILILPNTKRRKLN